MRDQYKILAEKYVQIKEEVWPHRQPGYKAYDVFILSELIDTLCNEPEIKLDYYKLKYKELVNEPDFDNGHWEMYDTKEDLKYAKEDLNYYYDYVFVSEILEKYAPPGVPIEEIDNEKRKKYLKKKHPGVYEDIYKKYSEIWIKDFKKWEAKWKSIRDELYKDNPGVNIDI